MSRLSWLKANNPNVSHIKADITAPSNIYSFKIDYKNVKTRLCELGALFDTDKSSQRNNVTNERHCHPYTILYDAIFSSIKEKKINIAEIGILDGGSLRMWQQYFSNADIFGFEYNNALISNFKNNYNNTRITLEEINVNHANSIKHAFSHINVKYDIIIEDSTHQFEDQIRVIENTYAYLNPGGILVIEDIFKRYNENDYIDRLNTLGILSEFAKVYFIELDHERRNSHGWDNDKLLILVKKGGDQNLSGTKITIITPSYRIGNLQSVKDSINFNYVDKWIIVYDETRIKVPPLLFNQPEIEEHIYSANGISGNDQRNFAIDAVADTSFIYFLDDDNLIHPDLYKLLDIISPNFLYTFDQKNRCSGESIGVDLIDTAMFLVKKDDCKRIRWTPNKYNADGYFITDVYNENKDNWIYIKNALSFYNAVN